MRIQHNIMAMSAYRNYTNNVSAMKKNLEKLSSGYKINRAGDDAAGLAISEKMRAQITGLETAQKNAKDGISLVQTAEGALQEVHDMLNRMVELATQSANGTYEGDTDRAQLQKEIEQLKSEINRIADSANFNGIKLLDGSMDADGLGEVIATGKGRIPPEYDAATNLPGVADTDQVGTVTYLDTEGVSAQKTIFYADLNKMNAAAATTGTIDDAGAQAIGGTSINGADATVTVNKDALIAAIEGAGVDVSALDDEAIKVNYSTDHWEIKVGTVTLTAQAGDVANDTANTKSTMDLKVDGTTVMTLTSGKDDTTAAQFQAVTTAADTGITYTAPAANPTVDLVINGETVADDVAVAAGDDAAAIATKVAAAMNGTANINGVDWNVEATDDGKIKFTQANDPTTTAEAQGNFNVELTVADGSVNGLHTGGTVVTQQGAVEKAGSVANTVYEVKQDDLKDGNTITIDGKTVTLAVGAKSTLKGDNVVNLKDYEEGSVDLDTALGRISEKFASGTKNFIVGVNDLTGTTADVKKGLTVHKKADSTQVYDTMAKMEEVFSVNKAVTGNKGLTLQIGDTADDYNQLKVSIKDCHAKSMGVGDIDISTQEGAAKAIDDIKAAINYVSDVRGTLGATQNRLDHTINNLSVMTENIQDAESTIRDVDIAEEMMAYTKNNILIQSAQAMLAQANQVPQGVLQLLQ